MKPDFDGSVVLANTVRVLRSEILPATVDRQTRSTLIGLIAVIETHLAQVAAADPTNDDESTTRAALMELDDALLSAFGGRLMPNDEEPRDPAA